MAEPQRQVIVARFDDRGEAQKALKALNKTLKTQNVELQQGALVTRAPDGILEIEKLGEDSNLRKLTTDAANLTAFLAVGSAKIVGSAVTASFSLLSSSIGKAAALAGAAAALTSDRARSLTGGDKPLRKIGGSLEPGASAVVVVVDTAHAAKVAAVLNGPALQKPDIAGEPPAPPKRSTK
jgi:uncharacterized membrane protein